MNKIYYKAVVPLLFMVFGTASLMAQTTISGKVTDGTTKEKLAGVNVVVKGKVIGTISDVKGEFNLKVNQAPPLTLVFSFIGFRTQELEIKDANTTGLEITLEEESLLGQEVVVSASRAEENVLKSPVSIEKMDLLAIKNTAAASFYDGLANLKGVDFSTQSLTFRSVNARGFGSNGNTRFVQLIDGVDNQAPGLNFPVGNIVGINDLDLESAELLPGPSSALYGPNALQGILLMNSKSPFDYQGLSAYTKFGVNHIDHRDDNLSPYQDYGFRYAKAFNNKFAFKITGSYLLANDFRGVDTRDQSSGIVENGAPDRTPDARVYDGVNTYGDFLFNLGSLAASPTFAGFAAILPTGADGDLTPRGFTERSFVSNKTQSIKLGGAAHYRVNDKLEVIAQVNWGNGSTVYTANDRFVLDNFVIATGKIELKGSNFYIRGYTTQENSGDSYAANTVASRINQQFYIPSYIPAYLGARTSGLANEAAHTVARNAANADQDARYLPGSPLFNRKVDSLRNLSIANGGAKFLDKSSLWHAEGSYNFKNQISWVNLIVGGNFRRYSLNSEGTLFALDNDGKEIGYNEFGGYLQASKEFAASGISVQASVRYDKSEFFAGQFSPRASIVKSINNRHFIRLSAQQGFRIPTTQDQFIDLDVVSRRLIGRNELLVNRYKQKTNTIYKTQSANDAQAAGDISLLKPATEVFDEYKSEKVRTIEVGYRGLFLDGKLLVDGNYFYNNYVDFAAEIDVIQAIPNGLRNDPGPFDPNSDAGKTAIVQRTIATQRYALDVNAKGTIQSQGWGLQIDYSLPKGYKVGGNVSYNELISQEELIKEGLQVDFNTPRYRYNLNFSNRAVTKKFGFNVTWRWQDAFIWQSAIGVGVVPEFGTLDAQISYKIPSIKTILKIGGSNILNERYTTSFANPSLGGIYYLQLTFDEFFN